MTGGKGTCFQHGQSCVCALLSTTASNLIASEDRASLALDEDCLSDLICTSTDLFHTTYPSCMLLGRRLSAYQSRCVCNTDHKGLLNLFIFTTYVEYKAINKDRKITECDVHWTLHPDIF